MSDPSGEAPPLLWPARLIRPVPRIVYLDLNHWIGLSKAATGHRDGKQHLGVLEACRAAAAGGVIFPVSSVTLIEIAKIKDPRQRADLAGVIEELSSFRTILGHPLLVTMELDAAISTTLGVPSAAKNDLNYVGSGVAYAFGQIITPNLIGHLRSADLQAPIVRTGDSALDLVKGFDRFVIQGPDDDSAAELRAGGWDPEAAWKVAAQRAAEERTQAGIFDAIRNGDALTPEEQRAIDSTDRKDWRRGRLRDAISVRELTQCIWDLFGQVMSWYGQPSLDALWADRDHARAFMRQMPSSEVAIELKTSLHRDAARAARWQPNDVLDIDQLAMVVPYCDVVVTEKAARDILMKAELDQRCNTVLLRRLHDLVEHL